MADDGSQSVFTPDAALRTLLGAGSLFNDVYHSLEFVFGNKELPAPGELSNMALMARWRVLREVSSTVAKFMPLLDAEYQRLNQEVNTRYILNDNQPLVSQSEMLQFINQHQAAKEAEEEEA